MVIRSRRLALTSFVVVLATALAACGGDGSSGGEKGSASHISGSDDDLIGPGRFGALTIGMDPEEAVESGLAIGPDPDAMCGQIYTTEPDLSAQGLYLYFDHEDPYRLELAGVIGWGLEGPPDFEVHTDGGLEIGSPAQDVVKEYGEEAVFATFPAEGDPYGAYVVFDGRGGALQILVDSAQASSASVVTGFVATSGRSLDDIRSLVGGC